jgi:hypothetical protein
MTRDFVKNTYKQGGNMWIWTNEHRPSARKTPAPGRCGKRIFPLYLYRRGRTAFATEKSKIFQKIF